MNRGKGIFSADYGGAYVYLNKQQYPLGYFVVDLLNQYYENDTVARLAVTRTNIQRVADTLWLGYLDERDFVRAGEEMLYMLKFLPNIQPFQTLNLDAERKRIQELFTEENAIELIGHFMVRGDIAHMDSAQVYFDIMPKIYDEEEYAEHEEMLSEVLRKLNFYESLSDNFRIAFHGFRKFVARIDEAERFDETHLLLIAMEESQTFYFPVAVEYVVTEGANPQTDITSSRRLHFDNYLSFILTDFFEGLRHGHYPRRCGICRKYFLMTSARRQEYCDGFAPELLRGKQVTCRKFAAAMGRKELAENDPIIALYNRRCAVIRAEKSKGTISDELAQAAKKLAKEHKLRAVQDDAYAAAQYSLDMEHEQLYKDAEKLIK